MPSVRTGGDQPSCASFSCRTPESVWARGELSSYAFILTVSGLGPEREDVVKQLDLELELLLELLNKPPIALAESLQRKLVAHMAAAILAVHEGKGDNSDENAAEQ